MTNLTDLVEQHGPAIVAENPRAVIGDNKPPLTPFEIVRDEILLLYQQAVDYLDGEPIATKGQADDIGNLQGLIRKAETKADEARIAENKPFDDGKDEVQARYNVLISKSKSVKGKTVLAKEACAKALEPWLIKLQAEIDAKAAAARKEADEKTRLAQQAMRASDATNLAERAAAEELLVNAKKAEQVANKAEKVTALAGGSGGRSIGLRTIWSVTVTDYLVFGSWAWRNRKSVYTVFLDGLAKQLVDDGARELAGCSITSDQKAV